MNTNETTEPLQVGGSALNDGLDDGISLLTPKDSKRVADALIRQIQDYDPSGEIKSAISEVLRPICTAGWKEDWFPLTIEEMCDKISKGVVAASYNANQHPLE